MHKAVISIITLLCVLHAACAGGSKSADTFTFPQASKEMNKETEELNRRLIEETFTSGVESDYPIGPGDLLDIQVLEAPDLNTEARVNSLDSISFPLLGKVDVGGLTSQEAEEKIRVLLTEKYMHDPHVVVSIKEFRSKRVAVIGSVKNPGTYEILGKGSLLDALALAGGLTPEASETAYVTRPDSRSGQKTVEIDLDELLDKGKSELNVPINMGDVVYVPEAGVIYVDGAVNQPGTVPLQDDMTVSQAITAAGGLSRTAEDSDIRLLRRENGQINVTQLDLKQIKEGTTPDMILEDQDAVVVGKNAIKSFFDAIKLGLFFPPFSVGVQ